MLQSTWECIIKSKTATAGRLGKALPPNLYVQTGPHSFFALTLVFKSVALRHKHFRCKKEWLVVEKRQKELRAHLSERPFLFFPYPTG